MRNANWSVRSGSTIPLRRVHNQLEDTDQWTGSTRLHGQIENDGETRLGLRAKAERDTGHRPLLADRSQEASIHGAIQAEHTMHEAPSNEAIHRKAEPFRHHRR